MVTRVGAENKNTSEKEKSLFKLDYTLIDKSTIFDKWNEKIILSDSVVCRWDNSFFKTEIIWNLKEETPMSTYYNCSYYHKNYYLISWLFQNLNKFSRQKRLGSNASVSWNLNYINFVSNRGWDGPSVANH